MSVALNSESEEVTIESWSLMDTGKRSKHESKYRWTPQSPVWWIGATAVCLVILLLTVILALVVQNGSTVRHWNKLQVGLMEYQNLVSNLTKDRDALRDERDQLRINSSSLAKDIEVLQSQYNTVAASRDELEEAIRQLNLSTADKHCHLGWVKFNNSCYYASEKRAKKTWETSRQDCLERGSDLVIITTNAELNFVTTLYTRTWIGLSDIAQEGKWKWVDGTDLGGGGFWQAGEPNNNGHEDCVEISRSNGDWNDVSCDTKIPWICEY
ncbi:CD209 antigen-like protein E [Seriola dumerili]|uniref:CD209 antigen-like protein E n=1 Tax=Seriola dumerili TaxID=41447 RepID=A0A3B4USN3_SERDU|nr:CD209 antigen-like protein E [Seriola dumerili]